jgi:hypothetical protein
MTGSSLSFGSNLLRWAGIFCNSSNSRFFNAILSSLVNLFGVPFSLLSDAELIENIPQNLVICDLAGYLSEVMKGHIDINGQ